MDQGLNTEKRETEIVRVMNQFGISTSELLDIVSSL